ncbi:MAG: DUF2158 domain-containing protein [Syntrophobacteraceae bacterium]|jgi:uncharacterized protein YodC (DUF2158 family)
MQKGTTVWLKSGNSPAMTIVGEGIVTGREKGWECEWFFNGEVKTHTFPEEALTETNPDIQSIIDFHKE